MSKSCLTSISEERQIQDEEAMSEEEMMRMLKS